MGKAPNGPELLQGFPKALFWGLFFFLMYINDLVDNISADVRLFAKHTSLFTIVYDESVADDQLNRDLKTISDWAYLWKMQFNPDKTKQAVQVIFSQKKIRPLHTRPQIYFNNTEVTMKDEETHVGLILDPSLTFHSHIKDKTIRANRGIGMIRYLSKYLTRDVLDQLYKLYVRPHLEYSDII